MQKYEFRLWTEIGDFFCIRRKFVLLNLIYRNLKLKYRQSFLGILWTLLIPALSGSIYYLVFKVIIKIQVPNYVFFLLLGITHWTFFVSSIVSGTEAIVLSHTILSKVPIPPHIFVMADVTTLFTNFVLSLPILLLVGILNHAPLGIGHIFLPILFFMFFLITYFCSLLCSLIYVYFRDIRQLIIILTQLLFYGTPILYKAEMIPPDFRNFFYLNPLVPLFLCLQQICIEGRVPDPEVSAIAVGWTVLLFIASFTLYQNVRYKIAEIA